MMMTGYDNMKMSQAKILHVETSSPNCGIARAALSAQEYEETRIEALPMPLKYSILILVIIVGVTVSTIDN